MTDKTVFELKAQARRLSDLFSAQGIALTHSQALDSLARIHGQRDWRELSGLLGRGQAQPLVLCSAVAKAAPAGCESSQEEDLLEFIEWHLRCNGFVEEDLDDLVHDVLAPDEASSVNNQGIADQLSALHEAYGSFDQLLALLRRELDGFDFERPAVQAWARTAEVPSASFDALPWLLQASSEQLRTLIRTSRGLSYVLGNCDMGDQVAEWSREHGRIHSANDRRDLEAFFEALRLRNLHKPELLGVTVEISRSDFQAFLEVRFDHTQPQVFAELQALLDEARKLF